MWLLLMEKRLKIHQKATVLYTNAFGNNPHIHIYFDLINTKGSQCISSCLKGPDNNLLKPETAQYSLCPTATALWNIQ